MRKLYSSCFKLVSYVMFLLLTAVPMAGIADELTIQYEYDDLNRLTRMSNSCGFVHTYSYDAAGNMLNKSVSRMAGTFPGCDDPAAVVSISIPNNQWILIGLPANSAQSTVDDVFVGALSAAGFTSIWTLFEYDPIGSNGGYRQMQLSDSMDLGTGYWFIQDSGGVIELQVPATTGLPIANTQGNECLGGGSCFTSEFPYMASATASWTILANPFPASESIESVFVGVASGSQVTTTGMDQQTAQIEHAGGLFVYRYNGSSAAYQLINSSGELLPWEAGWVGVSPNVSPVSTLFTGFTLQ